MPIGRTVGAVVTGGAGLMARWVGRRGDTVVIVFDAGEIAVLRNLAVEVDALLRADPAGAGRDPFHDRLFPRAYLDPTEDRAETGWQEAVHGDLVRSRTDALAALAATLDAGRARHKGETEVALTLEEADRWAGALNDARLALGVALGVTEDMPDPSPSDPEAGRFAVYQWLTWLQGSIVDALLGELPGGPPDADDFTAAP